VLIDDIKVPALKDYKLGLISAHNRE